jgi:hypothetical protein
MKVHLALAALVFLAGCTGGGGGISSLGGSSPPANGGAKAASEELTVYLSGLPDAVSGTEYFTIVAEASEDISEVKFLLYNLGSYLQSSCSGTSSLRDIASGQRKEVSCSLKATDTPLENTSQELMYEASYKISKYLGQVGFKVYDSEEYERVNPAGGEDFADLGVGELRVSPENVREGETTRVVLDLSGDLATGDNCGCNIEKVLLKIPRGFSVSGSSGWTRSSCGSFNCYEKRNVNVPLNEEFGLSIAGVTKTETFYIGVEVEGVWKLVRGSDTVVIPT